MLRGRYVMPPPASAVRHNITDQFLRIIGRVKVTIDLGNEELIPIRLVPEKLPLRANGEQVHVASPCRWITESYCSD